MRVSRCISVCLQSGSIWVGQRLPDERLGDATRGDAAELDKVSDFSGRFTDQD